MATTTNNRSRRTIDKSRRSLAAIGSVAVALFSPLPAFLLLPAHAAPPTTSALTEPFQNPPLPTKSITTLPVTTLEGKAVDLAAQPGWKVIYFWSAICPCVRACESFTFIPLSRKTKSNVTFFAVASDGYDLNQPHDWMTHKVAGHHLPFPVLRDDQHMIAKALGARVTPQAFLLDPQNRVVFSGLPDDSRRYQAKNGTWGVSQTYLAQAIRQAQAGQPVTALQISDEGCIVAW